MARPVVSLAIVDLDNTVYDWLAAFVPAFYAMVDVAAPLLDVTKEQLLDDLQVIHRLHGDSEHPFALLETEAVRKAFPGKEQSEIVAILDPAFHAFNHLRKQNLKLYDGVRDSLERLSHIGLPVIAYTDARVVNSLFRLSRLDITSLFTRLYAPAHKAKGLDQVDRTDFVRLLPPGDRKPNPRTLVDICTEFSVNPTSTVYVGDSLVRDIYMAKRAGVHSAWAKFGTLYDKELWPLLVRVTHWTEDDVEREHVLREQARGIEPDCVLRRFTDIFEYFEFKGVVQ
jgi:FMN phosphatase YigB (HAD superfamily)